MQLALAAGATGSVANWDMVVLLGYDPAIVPERVQITTGSGMESVPRIVVEKIEALGQKHRDFPMLCHTLPFTTTVDGVLGLDFFRGQRLVWDFRMGLVHVE